MHIAGDSSSLRLLSKGCGGKCRTEFLAELTGQRLSTLQLIDPISRSGPIKIALKNVGSI